MYCKCVKQCLKRTIVYTIKVKPKHNLSLTSVLHLPKPNLIRDFGWELRSAACQPCMVYAHRPPQPGPCNSLFKIKRIIHKKKKSPQHNQHTHYKNIEMQFPGDTVGTGMCCVAESGTPPL